MTADDRRYIQREAADLTDTSVDTLRHRIRAGQLPGAHQDPADPTGTRYVPAFALLAAGLLTAAPGQPESQTADRSRSSVRRTAARITGARCA